MGTISNFYKINNEILKNNPLKGLSDDFKKEMFKNKDILDIHFNHWIMARENAQRLSGTLEKGLFKISASVVEREFNISLIKSKRLIKSFVDKGIITPVKLSKCKGEFSIYAYTCVYSESKDKTKKEVKDDSKAQEFEYIYELWNNKNIIKHKKTTNNMIEAYKKARKNFTYEEITSAINNYKEVLEGDFYYKHKFTLENFLKQSNGIGKFVDEGEIYINYIDRTKENKNNVNQNNYQIQRKYTQKSEWL